jgi:hypothetical protein
MFEMSPAEAIKLAKITGELLVWFFGIFTGYAISELVQIIKGKKTYEQYRVMVYKPKKEKI